MCIRDRIVTSLARYDYRFRAQLRDLILDTVSSLNNGFYVVLRNDQYVAFAVKFLVDPLCSCLLYTSSLWSVASILSYPFMITPF